MTKTDWIPVSLNKGVFKNEYSVSLKTIKGNNLSLFANESLIRKDDSKNLLKVSLVNSTKCSKLILLPVEAIETGSRWVEVKSED
jgi:hypothetical protein